MKSKSFFEWVGTLLYIQKIHFFGSLYCEINRRQEKFFEFNGTQNLGFRKKKSSNETQIFTNCMQMKKSHLYFMIFIV